MNKMFFPGLLSEIHINYSFYKSLPLSCRLIRSRPFLFLHSKFKCPASKEGSLAAERDTNMSMRVVRQFVLKYVTYVENNSNIFRFTEL
jgi:hypothetical protein